MVVMDNALSRKLIKFIDLTDAKHNVINHSLENTRPFESGVDLVHEGQPNPAAYILCEGWTCSYKMMRGGGRQIVGFQIPGDFLGLRNVLFQNADINIQTVSDIRVEMVGGRDLLAAIESNPRLGAAMLSAAFRSEAMMMESMVSLGRRNATERTAHILLEFWERLRQVGMAEPLSYHCPLSQYHLADALGLSAVHVNRVLRELRDDGLLTFRKGVVKFDDFDTLVEIADFDAGYLSLNEKLYDHQAK